MILDNRLNLDKLTFSCFSAPLEIVKPDQPYSLFL